MVEICEGGFKHGAGFSQNCDVYSVFGHQALQFCFVEAHVVGDDIGWERVRVDIVRGEGVRVAELMGTGLHRQRHREVVALCEAEKQVLHGRAGCFVGLEEGHIGVLRFQSRGRVGLEGGTIEVEWLHDPKEKKVVTYLKVHYPQRKVNHNLMCSSVSK